MDSNVDAWIEAVLFLGIVMAVCVAAGIGTILLFEWLWRKLK